MSENIENYIELFSQYNVCADLHIQQQNIQHANMICQDIPFIVLSYDLTAHEKKPEIHIIIFGTRKFVIRKWLTLLQGTQEIHRPAVSYI